MKAYSIKCIKFGIIFISGPIYSDRKVRKYKIGTIFVKGLEISPKIELFVKIGAKYILKDFYNKISKSLKS